MYRNGTAFDYESVKGICYFHNNLTEKNSINHKFSSRKIQWKKRWKKEKEFS